MSLESHRVDPTARRFLLGEASESERMELEERMMLDDDAFEAMRAGEEELFDAAARGELTTRELERLADLPEAGERFAFAEALTQATRGKTTGKTRPEGVAARIVTFPERRPYRWLAMAAVLALALGTGWWWLLSESSRSVDVPRVAEFVLDSETLRGEGVELRISFATESVLLQILLFEATSDPLIIELLVDGEPVLRREGLTSAPSEWQRPAVTVEMPATLLVSGGYTLRLLAGEDHATEIARYGIEVERTE